MKYQQSYTIPERGVRRKHKELMCPHDMPFPSLMSALKTFMGIPANIDTFRAHNRTWENDMDYFYQMGVSGEGFGMLFDLPHGVIESNIWSEEALEDCFNAEGIEHRIAVGNDTKAEQLVEHLNKDMPLILVYQNKYQLVMGYEDSGKVIRSFAFKGGSAGNKAFSMMKNSKLSESWEEDVLMTIFIDGVCEPHDRKKISIKALERGYQMLTATEKNFNNYSFGEYLWNTWINRIDDDSNFKRKADKMRYIDPEKFDIAERRTYTAGFFRDCQGYLGDGCLKIAIRNFNQIHNKMWEVHSLVTGENEGKLLERETRDKVIDILKRCKKLDKQAATNIKKVLESARG